MINASAVTFRYPGAQAPAIQDLSFHIRDGEIFGFLGPSGAGKSTTQNLLIGLLRGFMGSIDVLGRPLSSWGREYYGQIGVAFETPNHYLKLTARENLQFFRALFDIPTAAPEELLAMVGLSDDIDKPVAAFSKGMKMRLTLARSLLHRPRLWFLDEPTAGLDPVNAAGVRDLIRKRQAEGVTTILTTHDMGIADAICDRVAFIVDGQLAECDAPSALKRRFGRREVVVAHGSPTDPKRAAFPMDGLGRNADFLQLIGTEPLVSLHSQETTLEDVFVQVTGRALA